VTGITGRIYLLAGEPVTVLTQWATPRTCEATPRTGEPPVIWLMPPKPNAPRNVALERADGSRTVRPLQGLRVPHEPQPPRRGHQRRRHRDEVYQVTLCLRCRHPGGQHLLNEDTCRLCACAGWWASPSKSAWSDRMTERAQAALELTAGGEQ